MKSVLRQHLSHLYWLENTLSGDIRFVLHRKYHKNSTRFLLNVVSHLSVHCHRAELSHTKTGHELTKKNSSWLSSNSEPGPQGYKKNFMLNSTEHEILNAHKYKNIMKFSFLLAQISLECYFVLLINVKMPTIVGILTCMSRKNFMLSWAEHNFSFIT